MAERRNLDRVQRPLGSQPLIHDNATVDALGTMVIALLGEVAVLRDRIDAHERLNAAGGGFGRGEVDGYLPDAPVAAERTAYRNAIYDRVLGAARDRLMPEALRQGQRDYEQVMDDVSER